MRGGRAAIALGAVLVAGLVVHRWDRLRAAHPEPADAAGPDHRSPQQRQLEETLAKTPCDRAAMTELAPILVDVDTAEAVERTGAFLSRCGEDPHVRQQKLRAHVRLKQWDSALGEANVLVRSAPNESEPHVSRGEIYEELGQYEDAAADYRDAIGIQPASNVAPLKLANVYERQGRACEAIRMLTRSIGQQRDADARRPLEDRLAELSVDRPCDPRSQKRVAAGTKARGAKPGVATSPAEPANAMPVNLTPKGGGETEAWTPSPPPSPKPLAESAYANGKAVVRYTPGHVAHTSVMLNGLVRLTVIVDTGAHSVAIPRSVAERLGMNMTSLRAIQISTAGGIRNAWEAKLSEVRLQGLVATNVPCTVIEDKDIGDHGLLGQSFLGRFKTTQDAQRGVIEIGN
ncbi:MAG: TIGR02281 family clan AA aspartic protease [Labilithrix sp.]